MAWGICGGGVWERLQVRLENGLPQLVMDLDSQIKTLVVYFVMMVARDSLRPSSDLACIRHCGKHITCISSFHLYTHP